MLYPKETTIFQKQISVKVKSKAMQIGLFISIDIKVFSVKREEGSGKLSRYLHSPPDGQTGR